VIPLLTEYLTEAWWAAGKSDHLGLDLRGRKVILLIYEKCTQFILAGPYRAGIEKPGQRGVPQNPAQQSDVIRSALRLGVPELMKRLQGIRRPRRNFADYLGRLLASFETETGSW